MSAVLLSAAISASAQPPAQAAAPPEQMVNLYGAGAKSCGTWLADRETPLHHLELQWVLGYLTASEQFLGEMRLDPTGGLSHTDANAVAAWLDKYCRENPLRPIAFASSNLVLELT
jgi:hypothetical protein